MKKHIRKATVLLGLAIAMFMPINAQAEVYSSESAEEGSTCIFITGDSETEDFYSFKDIFNDSISMYDSEALALYEQYLAQIPISISEGDEYALAALEGFTQYAVEEGIIEDTAVQRDAITKAVVRAEFKIVVEGGKNLGYTAAATLLNHSLQDHPLDLSFSSTSSMAIQIANSAECRTIINQFRADVAGTSYDRRIITGKIPLSSTTDLHLAYNNVDYSVYGVKVNGRWTLTITFTDTYDFEIQQWKNSMSDDAAVTVLNNYAACAQLIGAIVPYNITVTVQTTL